MEQDFQQFLREYFDGFSPPCWVANGEDKAEIKNGIVVVGFLRSVENNVNTEELIIVDRSGIFITPFVWSCGIGSKKGLVPDNQKRRKLLSLESEQFERLREFLKEFKDRFDGRENDLRIWGTPISPSVLWAMSRGLVIPPLISSVGEMILTLDI